MKLAFRVLALSVVIAGAAAASVSSSIKNAFPGRRAASPACQYHLRTWRLLRRKVNTGVAPKRRHTKVLHAQSVFLFEVKGCSDYSERTSG